MNMKNCVFSMLLGVCSVASLNAQTTLSGDHIITGDLNVGTTGAEGNLVITGETGAGSHPGLKVTGESGVLFEGTSNNGEFPTIANGPIFFWYPKKEALVVRGSGHGLVDTEVGIKSIAIGGASEANGESSLALVGGEAISTEAIAIGKGANAQGVQSIALGSVVAKAMNSTVIGRNSVDEGDEDTWVETDPLFVVGNGTGNPSDSAEVRNRNAFTVRKNGNVEVAGTITLPRQGDVLMGEFGNPE
jgi:hypothetical protein